MAFSTDSKVPLIGALVLAVACLLPVNADIKLVNNCDYDLTIFATDQTGGVRKYDLEATKNMPLNISAQWMHGQIWASRNGNFNITEATQVGFNIASPQYKFVDFFYVSVISAYNEAVMVKPTYIAPLSANVPMGQSISCTAASCTISNISSVCGDGFNLLAGPDNACINVNSGSLVDNPSVDLFLKACPLALAYAFTVEKPPSGPTPSTCPTGSNYDVIWCPDSS